MSDQPQEFDLKFQPDWVKETPAVNRYADFQGEGADRPRRGRDDRSPRGPRPAPGRGGPPPRRDGERRGPRSDRPGGGDRRPGPPGDRRGEGGGGPRRDDRSREDRAPREAPRPAPAALKVELLPEPNAAAGIARQIKASARAYALFQTSKLFLDRPERHRVRLTSADAAVPLFQVGDGPISFDRATVERQAFFTARADFYREETVQGDPIKGNFSNVARARATGALLGPTNHHGYQPALRKLYEERFARRMSFPEFQHSEIEIVTDEAVVAEWKEQARSTTTYATTQEAEPLTFKTPSEVEQHFRKTYLPNLVKRAQTLECSGQAARAGGDRHVGGAVRATWEAESRFPQQIVNGLRSYLVEAGLHFFKHRKRVLFVCAIKPLRHPAGQVFSDGITAILQTVEASPRIKRPDLAAKILGEMPDAPETATRKEALAADLHYLIHAGHVIEFSDGALELPLSPLDRPAPQRPPRPPQRGAAPAEAATAEPLDTMLAEAEESAADAPAGEDSIPAASEPEIQSTASTAEESAPRDPEQPAVLDTPADCPPLAEDKLAP